MCIELTTVTAELARDILNKAGRAFTPGHGFRIGNAGITDRTLSYARKHQEHTPEGLAVYRPNMAARERLFGGGRNVLTAATTQAER